MSLQESFSDGKFGVVKTFTERHYFYGGQVAESLKLFKFNSDQVKFLETVEPVRALFLPYALQNEKYYQLYLNLSFSLLYLVLEKMHY